MTGLLLGVDIGTASSKGVLVDPGGAVLARSVREHAVSTPRPGWFEHDAETVWWADFTAIVALEGIAYGVRHNLEAMASAGGAAGRLVAVGGGTKGGLWTRIVSDVTGLPQQIPAETIGACLGDALLAAEAVGGEVDPMRGNPIATTVTPDPENARGTRSSTGTIGRCTRRR